MELLELFSSEGCSSCPPADEWLASLRSDPGLWKRFVPVEFHVDYWNHLGWIDRFAKESFTSRQRSYAASWGASHVYTPGFVLSGREWTRGEGLSKGESTKRPGILKAISQNGATYRITFRPKAARGGREPGAWVAYGAILGNGLTSKVNSGENVGKTLRHEFVALRLANRPMVQEGDAYVAQLSLDRPPSAHPAESYSVAFWISRNGDPAPIQATGGDLEK